MLDEELDDIELMDEAPEEDGELYEHLRMVVDRGQEPVRIDKYMSEHIPHSSRNRIQNKVCQLPLKLFVLVQKLEENSFDFFLIHINRLPILNQCVSARRQNFRPLNLRGCRQRHIR